MRKDNQPVGVDDCHCFAVRKAARQVSRLYDAQLQPVGLRITQFLILAALNERDGTSVNGLAERLDIERTAMGKMVALLEKDHLVAIRPSPLDGRSRIVELTADGRELFAKTIPLWRAAQRQLGDLNGAENVAKMRHHLARLRVGSGTSSLEA